MKLEYLTKIILNKHIEEKLRIIRSKYFRFKGRLIYKKLILNKLWQKNSFYKILKQFPINYYKLKKYDNANKFITPLWREYNSKIEKALLRCPSFSFLQNPTIMIAMVATAGGKVMEAELEYLKKHVSKDKLRQLLIEDYVGEPLLMNSDYMTSHNQIHHLYHVIRFLNLTGCDLSKVKTIVEWGGGYGDLIKIFKRLKTDPTTYIMIDNPIFCCLQWLYLSVIFGEESVNLLLSPKDVIVKNKINIVSLSFLNELDIHADLFISTWALSESSKLAQDYIVKKKWFKSKHLLLAYQKSNKILPSAGRIGDLAKKSGAKIEELDSWSGNYYAFL